MAGLKSLPTCLCISCLGAAVVAIFYGISLLPGTKVL